jgi:hypothetical protein
MTSMRDIYDPPPAPVALGTPATERMIWTKADFACLATFGLIVAAGSLLASLFEPTLALVFVEGWYTAVAYLHRHPAASMKLRWITFVAALVPWTVGLGVAAGAMLILFKISDMFF